MTSSKFQLKNIAELSGHEDRVWSIAWNPSFQLLASASGDKTVRIYSYKQTPNSDELQNNVVKFAIQSSVPTGHAKTVRCVTWSPSGKTFATASFDANIGVWEQENAESDEEVNDEQGISRGEWECASLLEGHETECKSIAYSSTGTLLASCSRDKTVWVWEVQPDSDFECMGVLMTHTQDVKCVTWHPTEEILASGSYDNTIKLYVDDPSDDWYDFQTLEGHDSTVWSLAFSPCGEFLASASDDKTVRIWKRVEKWRWIPVLVIKDAHERSIYSISWTSAVGGKSDEESSENRGLLASTGGDGKINVWNIRTEDEAVKADLLLSIDESHGVSEVNCISWCPRKGFEHLLATAGDDCLVRIWSFQAVAQKR